MKISIAPSYRQLLSSVLMILVVATGCSSHSNGSKSSAQSLSNQGQPVTGKVIEAIQGGGYTYMELEHNGKQFWIASRIVRVEPNDIVSWENESAVTNYTSYALNRRFDEIYFVKALRIGP